MAKLHFRVVVTDVPGVSAARMKAYIAEALHFWGGSRSDLDPLGPPCPLTKKGAVRVTQLRRPSRG